MIVSMKNLSETINKLNNIFEWVDDPDKIILRDSTGDYQFNSEEEAMDWLQGWL